jgi:ankyrin repeat protein
VVRELLQAKPKVGAINRALLSAAKNFPGTTKELIRAGANVNYTDDFGNTALITVIECSLNREAQKKNRGEMIMQALLEAKANVNHGNNRGDTALIRAIQEHDFDAVQILLKTPQININHANNDGDTALIAALKYVQYMYVSGSNGQYNNCLDSQKILEKLLQTPGIDFHHANKNGDTAIKLLKKIDERMNH